MKKFFITMAFFIITVCLTGCKQNIKFTSFYCTEYTITQGTTVMNMLENYKSLELIFYENGDFKWVGVTAEQYDNNGLLVSGSIDEIEEGTYTTEYIYETDETNKEVVAGYKLTLYYDNNQLAEPKVYGYPTYVYTYDTLTRRQDRVTSTSHQIINQKFQKK